MMLATALRSAARVRRVQRVRSVRILIFEAWSARAESERLPVPEVIGPDVLVDEGGCSRDGGPGGDPEDPSVAQLSCGHRP